MKKFFYAFVLLVAMAFTGTISAHAATYKVYKADAVSYQSGQYQIRCNAITPAVSDWSWLNNGIPVNKVFASRLKTNRNNKTCRQLRNAYIHNLSKEDRTEIENRITSLKDDMNKWLGLFESI